MLNTILSPLVLVLLPLGQLPTPPPHPAAPPARCQLEVLSPSEMEERALVQFDTTVDLYVVLHRLLERSLPPEGMFDDPEDMWAAREALAAALLDARPLARQGNVFTPGAAAMIRSRLERAIAQHRHDPADVLAAINAERLPGMPVPEVNHAFPSVIGSAMWPTLLAALPPLPHELEYRFSDRDLVLIDVHANLVVDILDDALPAAEPTPPAALEEGHAY